MNEIKKLSTEKRFYILFDFIVAFYYSKFLLGSRRLVVFMFICVRNIAGVLLISVTSVTNIFCICV